jgi:hypothetical protein
MTSLDDTRLNAKHGTSGRLIAQDGDSVPVSITHHGNELLLVVLDRAGEFIAGPLDCMTLESSGARGIVRTPGTADVIEANLLRFTLDEIPEVVQRREFVRVTAAKRIVLENEKGDVIADALTVDISGGGLLVQLPRTKGLPHEGSIYFSLYLGLTDHDDEVNGTLRVVRRRNDNQYALVFEHISHANQQRLIRFVFERQRVALKVTRGDNS